MLLRIFYTTILGMSLLITGCDDVTNADLADQNQAIASGNVETAMHGNQGKPAGDSILDIAGSSEDFTILAAAVEFAGLGEALDGKRQLTVFAPTNDAFAKLLAPGQSAENLLNTLGKETVRDILLYHVAPGKRQANAVLGSEQINTLLKKFIDVELNGSDLTVGNNENGFANVIDTNIFASNGVIHVIDTVMLPPTSKRPPAK